MTIEASQVDRTSDVRATGGALSALVVGTDDWGVEQAAAALTAAGHRVMRCHEPGEAPFPCNALLTGRRCPLDAGVDVVVAIRTRPTGQPSPSEFGVICALHAGVPLVVGGLGADGVFGKWATRVVERSGDVATACEEAVSHQPPTPIDLPG